MSVIPDEPVAAKPNSGGDSAEQKPASLRQLKLWGLLVTLGISYASYCVLLAATTAIFLALQAERIGGKDAIGFLAVTIAIGAVVGMAAGPIAGMLADRTRTRIGGRAPWILFGSTLMFVTMILMGFSTSLVELVVYWCLIQVATSFITTPVSAHIPDRVPVVRRGRFSAVMGMMQMVGGLSGQVIAARFTETLVLGFVVVGAIPFLAGILFVVVNRRSNIGEPKPPLNLKAVLQTYWVNPVKYPNFAWVFIGRFLVFVGYYPQTAFTLYILQSYIGLGKADAVDVIPLLGVAGVAGGLVGTPLAGLLVDRIKRTKPLIFLGALFVILGLAVPWIWPTTAAIIALAFLSALGTGIYNAVDFVLITKVLPSGMNTGKDLGIMNIATVLPQTLGVLIGGATVTVFGGYGALFPVCITSVVLGALALFAVRHVK
ncbi:MFS transporter [Rhodococcus sp. T2V]|uniref:MFS transporter n=1 Tax=Rhodococcus sp. T2V TaxID=3034164 RepID=UPI0023E17D99|nr:MFS transporter [Rhodococcus sp. T2V]MDF3313335.1 MFS transporter [Rhodococcus sp. T2V]